MSTTTAITDQSAVVLARVLEHRAARDAAEAALMHAAVEWASLHQVDDLDEACVFADPPIPVAGSGAPLIAMSAMAEFSAAMGLSTDTGKHLLGEAVEVAYRLPRVWAAVQGGRLRAWQARRIAAQTLGLSLEAADWVDAQVAPYAGKIRPSQLDRTVAAAQARFMPAEAEAERQRAADGRHVLIQHEQVSFHGTSRIEGELDLADAIDLEAAVSQGAHQLRLLGSTESRDARRAIALGDLARRQLALGFDTEADRHSKGNTPATTARGIDLTVHISDLALAGCTCGAGLLARSEHGSPLITAHQVRDWCAQPGAIVRVRPVIDLNDHSSGSRYETPPRLREHVALRDHTCVFPWCTRPAVRCDHDHITPHDSGGPTCDCNLALLWRTHHRLKTHTRWTYDHVGDGAFVWRSPHGLIFRRDPTGTSAITPARHPS